MKRDKKFILKMNADERATLEKLAAKFERSQSDLVRYLLRREAAREFADAARHAPTADAIKSAGAQNATAR